MESETAKLAACIYKNGSANVNNLAAEENKLEKAMSFLPTLLQEVTHGVSDRGTQSQLLEDAQDLKVTKQDSKDCQSFADLKPAEAYVASQPSDMGPSVLPMDTSNAATSKEYTAGNMGENAIRGFTETFEQTEQTELSHKNVEYGLNMDSAGLPEAHASSQPPDTYSDSLIEGNTRFSFNSADVAVPPTENGVYTIFDGESEVLGPHTSMGTSETFKVSEVTLTDVAKQQLSSQETGVAVVVSTDLHGWQRFDVEDDEVDRVFGYDQPTDGKSHQKRELWEQLLEDGSEDNETHFRMSTSHVEAETHIAASLHDMNQFWLASPGNPFIEGLDRLSNFSETDGFTANENIASSQLPHSFEAGVCLPFKEAPLHTDYSSTNLLQDKLVEGNLASQSNVLYDHGSRRHAKPRFPSFSDIRRSSSKSRDPSFSSFIEQVPTFQAGNYVPGIENGGEKWEANFDLMVPATQGPRSLSLPREAGDNTHGQRQKGTFSLFSREAPAASQSKPSGFLSPKLSPIVKKVVNKVWAKPEQVVRHEESSNIMDKEPKKWMWRCCVCCSHAN